MKENYFEKTARENSIDGFTYKDLHLDSLYKKLNKVHSTPGEEVLYFLLRTPEKDVYTLKKREEIISYFKQESNEKKKLEKYLSKVGKTIFYTGSVLWNKLYDNSSFRILSIFGAFLPTILIILFLYSKSTAILISAFVSIMINYYLAIQLDKLTAGGINSLGYFGRLFSNSEKISKIKIEPLQDKLDRIKEITKKCSAIRKRLFYVQSESSFFEGLTVIFDYCFMVKANIYFSLLKELHKDSEIVRELYFLIGEIDAYISISKVREECEYYCTPVFIEGKSLKMVGMYHPLVEKPISNDVILNNNGIMLTGSNMSGKSTFLRTIGVNAIMAQTFNTVFAKAYEGSFFNIVTSISPEDNIEEGKSYYLAEAESILRIINSSKGEEATLGLIDEIFRGTNPVERIAAASHICNYLVDNNCVSVVATHDLELTKLVKNYHCFYFKETVEDGKLKFDYRLREGVSNTRNAVRLLAAINYPKDLLDIIEEDLAFISAI